MDIVVTRAIVTLRDLTVKSDLVLRRASRYLLRGTYRGSGWPALTDIVTLTIVALQDPTVQSRRRMVSRYLL